MDEDTFVVVKCVNKIESRTIYQ